MKQYKNPSYEVCIYIKLIFEKDTQVVQWEKGKSLHLVL